MQDKKVSSSLFRRTVANTRNIAIALVFLFAIAPILLAAIPSAATNETFSIYNTGYDGLSIVRNDLEAVTNAQGTAPKYEVTNLISNLNALNRFNGSGVLVIVGPAADFEVTETMSVLLYLLRGGSMIIADDFGTGNQILEPLFNLFDNLDKLCQQSLNNSIQIPCLSDILSGEVGGNNSSNPGNSTLGSDQLGGGDTGSAASDYGGSFLTALLKTVKGFGFNHTGVLMDAERNYNNPARPIIEDIDTTEIPGLTFTQNVNKVQLEFASVITIKLKISEKTIDPDTGEEITINKTVYQPLQKISAALVNQDLGGAGGDFDLGLPFFPLYTSKSSWIETDVQAANDGTAQPDPNEWGNAKFAVALSVPLMPGMGKIVFLADPSIFINRWTEKTTENDNLILIRNLIDMATEHQEITADNPRIPVIFDFGHTYQSLLSPALYSTALLKLIAELSMFPLYAPFVPFAMYGYGKKLMPKSRRLRPILLTKRRGETGHSDYEKKIAEIKEFQLYGQPIAALLKRILYLIRTDAKYDGPPMSNDPKVIARFLVDNYPSQFVSRRELERQIRSAFDIARNPNRIIKKFRGETYLRFLKRIIDIINR